jgi:very-short-patch-repair endonuclease
MDPKIQQARELRSKMSEPEVILWARLKRLRERGFHIRRQFPFRGCFLDFVCFSRRLVIEVDGSQHGEEAQAEHDAVRDRMLARQGYRVLRVSAREVRSDLNGLMDRIVEVLEAAAPAHPKSQPACSEPGPDFPTLTASRSVPPH